MANVFMQNQSSQGGHLEQKLKTARINLLFVVIFTSINLFLLVTNSNSYFLFSAFLPYFLADLGMYFCGRYPAEYYGEEYGELLFFNDTVFFILMGAAIILTLLYLLAWFMSRKQGSGWFLFALVFFIIDTVGMLFIGGISIDVILDILFHAWVIYYLVLGINACNQLKKLPEKEETVQYNTEINEPEYGAVEQDSENTDTPDSRVIRIADSEVKHRVLAEAQVSYYKISYRRVKHTNELIVNGKVYDEINAVLEYPHTLKAWVDGHYITAGYSGTHSFITVDGEEAAKKVRII